MYTKWINEYELVELNYSHEVNNQDPNEKEITA